MGLKNMTGTPWHITTLGTGEGRTRHKNHCKYIDIVNGQCTIKLHKCTGSAHCDEYEKLSKTEETHRNKKAAKYIKANDDYFAKKRIQQPPVIKKSIKNSDLHKSDLLIIDETVEMPKELVPGAIAKYKKGKQGIVIEIEGNILTIKRGQEIIKTAYPNCLNEMDIVIKNKL